VQLHTKAKWLGSTINCANPYPFSSNG
jgi:hypothetical protein